MNNDFVDFDFDYSDAVSILTKAFAVYCRSRVDKECFDLIDDLACCRELSVSSALEQHDLWKQYRQAAKMTVHVLSVMPEELLKKVVLSSTKRFNLE